MWRRMEPEYPESTQPKGCYTTWKFWEFAFGLLTEDNGKKKKKKRAITEANPMLSFEPEKWRIKKWFDIDGTE